MSRAEDFRNWANTTTGRIVCGVVCAIGLLAVLWSLKGYFSGSEASGISSERQFICSETGKPFPHTLEIGETIPVTSPHSGKATGYPAEACYWTKDGKIKTEPTYVLLNEYAGKKEPTFCPDCGRLVRAHNPFAQEGAKPPPTQGEYKPTPAKSRE